MTGQQEYTGTNQTWCVTGSDGQSKREIVYLNENTPFMSYGIPVNKLFQQAVIRKTDGTNVGRSNEAAHQITVLKR